MTKVEMLSRIAEENGHHYTAEYVRMFDGKDLHPWVESKAHAKKLNDTIYKECVQKKKSMRELYPDIFDQKAIY